MGTDYYERPPFQHPRMPIEQRAKQFAPFAALTTYDSAITGEEIRHKQTEKKLLSEDSIKDINNVVCKLNAGDKVNICFFIEGRYRELIAFVNFNDRISKFLRLAGGACSDIDFSIKVPYADIYRIEYLS